MIKQARSDSAKKGWMSRKKIEVVFEKIDKRVIIPCKMSDGSSGYDIRAFLDEPVIIPPKKSAVISTGLRLMIPDCLEAQIRPRSGLAMKHGIMVTNSPGTIDSDYRGEIKILLFNSGDEPFLISNNDRIAQMVFSYVPDIEIKEGKVEDTSRNSGGFGSTGRK